MPSSLKDENGQMRRGEIHQPDSDHFSTASKKANDIPTIDRSYLSLTAETQEYCDQSFRLGLPFTFFLGLDNKNPLEVTASYKALEIEEKSLHVNDTLLYYTHRNSTKIFEIGALNTYTDQDLDLVDILLTNLHSVTDNNDLKEEVYARKIILAEMFRLGVVVEKTEAVTSDILANMDMLDKKYGIDLALVRCINLDHTEMSISLLRQGASITATGDDGHLALFSACKPGNEAIVRAMLERPVSKDDLESIELARQSCRDQGNQSLEKLLSDFLDKRTAQR